MPVPCEIIDAAMAASSRPGIICAVSPSVLAGMFIIGSGGSSGLGFAASAFGGRVTGTLIACLPGTPPSWAVRASGCRRRHRRRQAPFDRARRCWWADDRFLRREGRRRRPVGASMKDGDREEDDVRRDGRAHADARLRVLEGKRQLGRMNSVELYRQVPRVGVRGRLLEFSRSSQTSITFPGIVPRLARPRRCKSAAHHGRCFSVPAETPVARATCPPHRTPLCLDAAGRSRDALAGRASTRYPWRARTMSPADLDAHRETDASPLDPPRASRRRAGTGAANRPRSWRTPRRPRDRSRGRHAHARPMRCELLEQRRLA